MCIFCFFYLDIINVDEEFVFSSEVIYYVVNVLCLKVGYFVVIFNGDGSEYIVIIIVVEWC